MSSFRAVLLFLPLFFCHSFFGLSCPSLSQPSRHAPIPSACQGTLKVRHASSHCRSVAGKLAINALCHDHHKSKSEYSRIHIDFTNVSLHTGPKYHDRAIGQPIPLDPSSRIMYKRLLQLKICPSSARPCQSPAAPLQLARASQGLFSKSACKNQASEKGKKEKENKILQPPCQKEEREAMPNHHHLCYNPLKPETNAAAAAKAR